MKKHLRQLPNAPNTFSFLGHESDDKSGVIRFRYGYDNGLEFCETLEFNHPLPAQTSPLRNAFDATLCALNVLAGVSYYKAFAPSSISLGSANFEDPQLAFFQSVYVNGLGEFGYRNRINVSDRIDFVKAGNEGDIDRASSPAFAEPTTGGLPRKSAVLIGGGKDSLVSIEVLKAANEPMVLFAVNPQKPIVDCANASGLPFQSVVRRLDPRLFDLNDVGALNGHVPITAIVSFIAIAAAFVHGYDAVILSNERSADEGNVAYEGHEINHQYSKTLKLEAGIRNYIAAYINTNLSYFSLLRPLSEFHIARLMAKTDKYDECFTSCNSAFRVRERPTTRWCRDCPKCRFAFLILATAMPPDRLCSIFGGNLLDGADQITGYEELTGLSGHKPWECVGEIAESGAAVLYLASQPLWAKNTVIEALTPRLSKLIPRPNEILKDLFTPSSNHFLPKRYEEMLYAYLGSR